MLKRSKAVNEISMDEVCVLLGRKDIDIYLGLKREMELNQQIQALTEALKKYEAPVADPPA